MVMCLMRKRHRREKSREERRGRPGSQGPSANLKTQKHGSGVEKPGKEALDSEIHKSSIYTSRSQEEAEDVTPKSWEYALRRALR